MGKEGQSNFLVVPCDLVKETPLFYLEDTTDVVTARHHPGGAGNRQMGWASLGGCKGHSLRLYCALLISFNVLQELLTYIPRELT